MDLLVATRRFAARYYLWARADARREVDDNFPRVRGVKGKMALRAVSFFDALTLAERHECVGALVRRFHPEGMAECGESMTTEDQNWVKQWLAAAQSECVLEGLRRGRARLGVFRRVVVQQLSSILGAEFKNHSSTTGAFHTRIGRWTLVTTVGFGAKPFYSQHIWAGPRAALGSATGSLLARLGLTGQTTWDLLGAGDEEEAAVTLTSDCAVYLRALPELLKDLAADDVPLEPAEISDGLRPRLASKG
jgi:hypothetical protein